MRPVNVCSWSRLCYRNVPWNSLMMAGHKNAVSSVQWTCRNLALNHRYPGLYIALAYFHRTLCVLTPRYPEVSAVTAVSSPHIHDDVIKWKSFRVTGSLWGESSGHRWTPHSKASGVELWRFLWSAPEQTIEQAIETLVIRDAMALIMTSLQWWYATLSLIRIVYLR